MFADTPLVSRKAEGIIKRARTPTLVKRFNDLNCFRYKKAPPEFGDLSVDGRARQLMDRIVNELGYRYMKELRNRG